MRRILTATLLTTAISSVAITFATPPAFAQMDQTYGMDQADSGISLDYFSDQLAPFGYWLYSDRWGLVWQPGNVSNDFQPYYSSGHWLYTDEYGWYWQSEYPWGDIPFHYGRWVNDPDDGWLWIPGYVWSPGWVTWRSNDQYIGWMPTPPDDAFLGGRGDIGIGGLGFSLRFGPGQAAGLYGYSRWYGPRYNENLFARNWVFVGLGQIENPDYRAVAVRDPVQVVNIIHRTRDVTHYTVVNNYVVNKSVDVRVIERAAGRPIPVVRAATVIRHPNLVATVSVGQRVQMRMRVMAPRGTGIANSAPPPPPRVVAKLSTRVPPPKAGRPPMHLFNKAAVTAPDARAKFQGQPAPEAGPGAGGGMTGPNGGPPGMGPGGPISERPGRGGPNGPNGGQPNSGQPNSGQPGGEMGGPNGPSGPGTRPHREPPGSMNGPNGGPPQGTGGAEGGSGPNAGAPGGEMNGPGGPTGERPHRTRPDTTGPNGGAPPGAEQPDNGAGPNGGSMNGPGGPTGERVHRAPPGGGAGPDAGPPGGSMSGPGGPGAPSGERPHREPPNGMNGPNGGPPPGAGRPGSGAGPNAEPPRKPEPNAPQGNPPHPPKKPPPQNPPQ